MYYINGQYVKEDDAKISILDLSILRGYGVFDYLRTYRGRPFHLHDHLLRLKYSAEHIGLSLPYTFSEIEDIVDTLLKRNNFTEASIKILVTGGISDDQFTPKQANLILFAYPLTAYPPHYFTEGVKVITTRLNRSLPTAKTTQYTPAIVALQRGKEQNAKEALYLNAKNEILEATTSNFFAFKDGVLHTCCSDEVLIGITREVIARLCPFPLLKRALLSSEIPLMQEAFLTASNKEVMPVTEIDSHPIGDGRVGPHTQKIMALFKDYTENSDWPLLNIPRYN